MKLQLPSNESSMKDLFFIVKGQYRRDYRHPDNHLLGYDPSDPNTNEWYMLIDNKTFNCVCCSSDLQKVLEGVRKSIKKHNGRVKSYLNSVNRSPSKTSARTQDLYRQVYAKFGDYYEDEVREMEGLAYDELRHNTPAHKSYKAMERYKGLKCELKETPSERNTKVVSTLPMRKLKKSNVAVKRITLV